MPAEMVKFRIKIPKKKWFSFMAFIASLGYCHINAKGGNFTGNKIYLRKVRDILRKIDRILNFLKTKEVSIVEIGSRKKFIIKGTLDEILISLEKETNQIYHDILILEDKKEILKELLKNKNKIIPILEKNNLISVPSFKNINVFLGITLKPSEKNIEKMRENIEIYRMARLDTKYRKLYLGSLILMVSKKIEEKSIDISPLKVIPIDTFIRLSSLKIDPLSLKEICINLEKILQNTSRYKVINNYLELSGFIPSENKNDFIRKIRKKFHEASITIEKTKNNPIYIKSVFRHIIGMAGYPMQGEIDPTPIFSITFPLFFGLMFGDIGHGLVLLIVGLLLYKYSPYHSRRDWGKILIFMGISSLFFGILAGEVFGIHLKMYKPLITIYKENEHYEIDINSLMTLLGVSMLIGVIHITIGYILRVMNLMKNKEYDEAIFFYIPLIIMYIFSILYISSTPFVGKIVSRDIGNLSLGVLIASIIVILFSRPEKIFHSFIELFISILEMASNTISYSRLIILFLIHTFLMQAVNLALPLGIMGIPILIVGNAGIIALEGLMVFIQALRLHFYEFFSKFYRSGGIPYLPLLIESRYSSLIIKSDKYVIKL